MTKYNELTLNQFKKWDLIRHIKELESIIEEAIKFIMDNDGCFEADDLLKVLSRETKLDFKR